MQERCPGIIVSGIGIGSLLDEDLHSRHVTLGFYIAMTRA